MAIAAVSGPTLARGDNGAPAAVTRPRRLAALPWLLPLLWRVLHRAPTPDLARWLTGDPGALWRLEGRELWLAIALELDGGMGRPRDAATLDALIDAARDWLATLPRSDLATVDAVLEVLNGHGWARPDLVDCDRWECFLALLDAIPAPA